MDFERSNFFLVVEEAASFLFGVSLFFAGVFFTSDRLGRFGVLHTSAILGRTGVFGRGTTMSFARRGLNSRVGVEFLANLKTQNLDEPLRLVAVRSDTHPTS